MTRTFEGSYLKLYREGIPLHPLPERRVGMIRKSLEELIKDHKKLLMKGRVKKLGLIEKLLLKRQGAIDGSCGLPGKHENGGYTSPFINSEVAALKEFAFRAWGRAQLELEQEYARLGELLDSIKRAEEDIATLEAVIARSQTVDLKFREQGEEQLSDEQVARRRRREAEKSVAVERKKVQLLRSQIEECYVEMNSLYNHVVETNTSVRMIIQRVREHSQQRRQVYWDSALKNYAGDSKLPVTATDIPMLITQVAEDMYVASHRQLEEEANDRLLRWRKTLLTIVDDKEVA